MRNESRLAGWLKTRWLEVALLIGLVGLLIWYANVGLGFAPRPTPTPQPQPTPAVRSVATHAPTPVPSPTPQPTEPPTSTALPGPGPTETPAGEQFSGRAAYEHVLAQTQLGPRPAGSDANKRTQDYITNKLAEYGWQVEGQDFTYMNTACRNIIGKAGSGPVVILGAHFDTRRLADNDPDQAHRNEPVMGANDGASGVAVLLELARVLDRGRLPYEVRLAFFDAEDNGRLDGWDFIAGSRYMADHLDVKPQAVIVVDMIGDADQQIYREQNSTPALQDSIWQVASDLGLGDYFKPTVKYSMEDDHSPFLAKGIAASDLIDFDYPYWHTTQDTADKVSAASLEHVGLVLQAWLAKPL